MATSINSYSVSLGMDAAGYINGAGLARSETRALTKDIEAARTPMETFAFHQNRLAEAFNKGAIDIGVHQRLHAKLREDYGMTDMSVRTVAGAIAGPLTIAFGAVAIATTAAVATGVAFLSHMKETQDQIDSVVDSATKLGLSYNELTGLRFAAQEGGGVDAATVDASIKKMQINIANAVDDPGSAVNAAFKKLGVNAGDLMKSGPVEAVKLIADGMQGVTSGADRLKIAMDIFGKSGTELVSTLAGGRDAIGESVDFMNQMAGLTDAQTIAVGMSNDAYDRIGVIVGGISTKLAAEVAPAFLLISESVLGAAGGASSLDENMQFVVNTTAYYLGQLKDVAELFIAMPMMLMGVGSAAGDAFDLSSGQKAMDAVIAKRQEIEGKASEKETERKAAREKMLLEETESKQSEADKANSDRAYLAMIDRVIAEENKRIEMEDRLASNAMKAAESKFAKERANASKLRDDIAKGPGSGMEQGSAEAAKFLADQANAALAAAAMPDQAMPTEEQLLEEARKQFDLALQQSKKMDDQTMLLKKIFEKPPEFGKAR